jgi:N-glycosylase/DNA lyase
MSDKEYKLVNQESFELEDIFECGQCFRWNKEEDGSYTGVIKNAVINVQKNGNEIIFRGNSTENFKELIYDYFDLNTNYEEIKAKLACIDENLKISTEFGKGIRILKQDLWECIISFIISANNNIPRIKKIIEKLSYTYGKKIEWNEKEYYLFPTPESLSHASVEDLRNMGLGFRDIRVFNTTQMILKKKVDIEKLPKLKTSYEMREELLKLDGVGPKVADCILLFALRRFDVFPIDVWVRRVMNELYIKKDDESKVNKKELAKLAEEKFLGMAGIAQQYLFYYRRSGNIIEKDA